MSNAGNAIKIIDLLEKQYPYEKKTVLSWNTPLDLLIATILSAQSTDQQINKITSKLFKKYITAKDYVEVSREELEDDIKSSGFYKRKTELIKSACKQILEEFNGEVPRTMDELLQLQGVARKTANIVLSNAFGVIEGIAVDTHVMRLSQRLGLSNQKDRNKIEKDLMSFFPKELWGSINYLLITHGRRICNAKKPNCTECLVNQLCPSAFKFKHYLKI
ncbi:endonuclease III [Candidatus Bathyarchaeota archaeon]|nr:endonuclease III [Candidatus Bathyarchaeota archaeon]